MTQSPIILVNSQRQNHISVLDRGLSYGDGVFETMLSKNADICLWQYHYERLQQGLQRLQIDLQQACIVEHLQATMRHVGQQPAVVKLMVTRGAGGRGYSPDMDNQATLISQITPLDSTFISENNQHQRQGVEVHCCETALPVSRSLAGIKSLNQLSYVLACLERRQLSAKEGLLFTSEGLLIEATARNIFIVKDDVLHTPSLTNCGVEVVMRRVIVDNLSVNQGITVREGILTKADLLLADEVFLTNSVGHIWPVIACDDKVWPVGFHTGVIQREIDLFLKQETGLSLSSFLSNHL
jgi:4-amino-4-deoxychorismate lyase